MKKILFLFSSVVFSLATLGQQASDYQKNAHWLPPVPVSAKPPVAVDNGYKKNSIGLDLVPLVQNMVHSDSLIPYGVVYRRFITPNHALRGRLDVGYIKEFNEWGKKPIERKEWALGFTVGYQYSIPLTKWADILFALDVGAQWERKKTWDDLYAGIEGQPWIWFNRNRNYERWTILLQPTVELHLKWTQHISLGLATSPQYSYRHNYAESFGDHYSTITGEIYSSFWMLLYKDTKQSITPVCNILLLYNF